MISYAQNHEDVVLERCFRHQENGFYIDVGAWDPILDSVTQHFYLKGWRGVNVEPVSEYFSRLQTERPRDINLQCVLSDTIGPRVLRTIEGTGLSTTCELDAFFVEDLSRGGYTTKEMEVSATTLATVCSKYVPADLMIDFLKVDVEGAEAEVLRGADWRVYRPRVLVIEAQRPVVLGLEANRAEFDDLSGGWEPELLRHGYLFALTDGVNRFYVREEDSELLQHFRVPANALDHYVPYSTWAAETDLAATTEELAAVREHLAAAKDDLGRAGQTIQMLETKIQQTDERLADVLSSRSWKLTAPIRSITGLLRRQ